MENLEANDNSFPCRLYDDLTLASANSIRVLDVLPAKRDDEVRTTLRVVSLDSDPVYEALSYTWGKPDDQKAIKVNDDYDLPVTNNLFRALRNLRDDSETRTLWVDAICINQADVDECNRQVNLVGLIYQTAVCVDIWLGEHRPSFTKTLKLAAFCFCELFEYDTWNDFCNTIRQDPIAIDDAMKALHRNGIVVLGQFKNTFKRNAHTYALDRDEYYFRTEQRPMESKYRFVPAILAFVSLDHWLLVCF